MRSGDVPRATEIKSAKSALDAKKIGNMVTPSPSFTDNQFTLMTEIIEAKASQVPSFSEFLKNLNLKIWILLNVSRLTSEVLTQKKKEKSSLAGY